MSRARAGLAGRRSLVSGLFFFALWLLVALPASGTTETTMAGGSEVDPAAAQLGFDTYSANCAGCHQAGGTGVEDTFPPLIGNPNVEDAAYLVEVIRNGRQGAIEVGGVAYDGVMPAFSTLSDEEVEGLIAYIQGGFVVPGGGDTGSDLPLATGTLPDLTWLAVAAAFGLAAVAGVWVLWPRIGAVTNRLELPWLDAWFRTAIIVVGMIVAVALLPSMILKTEVVGRLPGALQDVIGLVLWGGGLLAGLGALWWAHRENRI
jgi:mono/diheme cytochrome c family protein